MTQVALANGAKLTSNFVAMIERGERGLTVDTAIRIADSLQVRIGSLLNYAERYYHA